MTKVVTVLHGSVYLANTLHIFAVKFLQVHNLIKLNICPLKSHKFN